MVETLVFVVSSLGLVHRLWNDGLNGFVEGCGNVLGTRPFILAHGLGRGPSGCRLHRCSGYSVSGLFVLGV